MEFPVEVPLKRPITLGDDIYPALMFDEPDLGLNIAVAEAKNVMDQTVILLAGMAGVDRDVILKLKESDYRTVEARVLVPYQASVSGGDPEGNAPPAGAGGASPEI